MGGYSPFDSSNRIPHDQTTPNFIIIIIIIIPEILIIIISRINPCFIHVFISCQGTKWPSRPCASVSHTLGCCTVPGSSAQEKRIERRVFRSIKYIHHLYNYIICVCMYIYIHIQYSIYRASWQEQVYLASRQGFLASSNGKSL